MRHGAAWARGVPSIDAPSDEPEELAAGALGELHRLVGPAAGRSGSVQCTGRAGRDKRMSEQRIGSMQSNGMIGSMEAHAEWE